MQQAEDFLAESEALYGLVASLDEADMERPTAFKGWTINHVIRHLHVWNFAADLSLTDGDAFQAFFDRVGSRIAGSLKDFETEWLEGLAGAALVERWRSFYTEMADRFGAADPSMRVRWAGPDMSVRSSITARLMETWAHGQEVYDELGVVRVNQDRIRNIAVLGNNTHGWTYAVRGEAPPVPVPHLVLTAPSGAIWRYNEPSHVERIEGLAEAFCQVVTQVRNIADTDLVVTGPNATDWMSKAQCFAGPPETPPAPGTRRTRAA
ncbi:MAG: TIGR03084 family metal-binding protein [Gammaproteobacteria bacterium]